MPHRQTIDIVVLIEFVLLARGFFNKLTIKMGVATYSKDIELALHHALYILPRQILVNEVLVAYIVRSRRASELENMVVVPKLPFEDFGIVIASVDGFMSQFLDDL